MGRKPISSQQASELKEIAEQREGVYAEIEKIRAQMRKQERDSPEQKIRDLSDKLDKLTRKEKAVLNPPKPKTGRVYGDPMVVLG